MLNKLVYVILFYPTLPIGCLDSLDVAKKHPSHYNCFLHSNYNCSKRFLSLKEKFNAELFGGLFMPGHPAYFVRQVDQNIYSLVLWDLCDNLNKPGFFIKTFSYYVLLKFAVQRSYLPLYLQHPIPLEIEIINFTIYELCFPDRKRTESSTVPKVYKHVLPFFWFDCSKL